MKKEVKQMETKPYQSNSLHPLGLGLRKLGLELDRPKSQNTARIDVLSRDLCEKGRQP